MKAMAICSFLLLFFPRFFLFVFITRAPQFVQNTRICVVQPGPKKKGMRCQQIKTDKVLTYGSFGFIHKLHTHTIVPHLHSRCLPSFPTLFFLSVSIEMFFFLFIPPVLLYTKPAHYSSAMYIFVLFAIYQIKIEWVDCRSHYHVDFLFRYIRRDP